MEVPSWKETFQTFSQETTFHGIRYVGAKAIALLRRLCWIIIISGVTGLFLYLITERTVKYLDFEKNVNVEVAYDTSIAFPAVTICNQNFYRATKAKKEGLYDIIHNYFSDTHDVKPDPEPHNESCDRVHVGQMGVTFKKMNTLFKFARFADTLISVCHALCLDFAKISPHDEDPHIVQMAPVEECLGFTYHKVTHVCRLATTIRKYQNQTSHEIVEVYENLTLTPANDNNLFFFEKMPCNYSVDVRVMAKITDAVWLPKAAQKHLEDTKWMYKPGELIHELGHDSADMFYGCSFAGDDCSANDFLPVMTDYGLCYTFNSGQNNKTIIFSNRTGSTSGLHLIVNMESYEYMSGPHTDSGIKLFLHPQDEIPMIGDLGFAVPPGRHSLIAVKTSELQNIPEPWGDCGTQSLEYYDEYSWFRCQENCKIQMLVDSCGCRAPFMHSHSDQPPVCNLTHYFTCAAPEIYQRPRVTHGLPRWLQDLQLFATTETVMTDLGNETSVEEASINTTTVMLERKCQCIQPCHRVIYEPSMSNAALSEIAIEEILAGDNKVMEESIENANEVRHRVRVHDFLHTTAYLVRSLSSYEAYLAQCEDKSAQFQHDMIEPTIASINALGDIFQHDMNRILFDGLKAGMHEILKVYGPSRDTIYSFLDQVIKNAKEVSLHLKHLIIYGHLGENLGDLVNKTRFYAEEVIESLPTYYQTVVNTSKTLQSIEWEIHNLSFFPSNLAKRTPACNEELQHFVNLTLDIELFLEEVTHIMERYAHGQTGLDLKRILRELYSKISEFEDHYVFFREECLEQFINAVDKLHEFNKTYDKVLHLYEHLEYDFNYEKESQTVQKDYIFLRNMAEEYLTHANTTKVVIQYNLTELVITEMIARSIELVTKIKFRLMERFHTQLDVIRLEFTDLYTTIQKRAIEFQQYLTDHYMENRAVNMQIWHGPVARTPGDDDHGKIDGSPIYFSETKMSENWTTSEYLHQVSLTGTHDIIKDFFMPVNGVLNHFEELLNHFGRELETSLQELQTWMIQLRSEDDNSVKFVLGNFLEMDVYFAELRKQRIIQKPSYSLPDLWGDIGGYMGLLLGASLVTVWELIDLLVVTCLTKTVAWIKGSGDMKAKNQNIKQYDDNIFFGTSNGNSIARSKSMNSLINNGFDNKEKAILGTAAPAANHQQDMKANSPNNTNYGFERSVFAFDGGDVSSQTKVFHH